MSRQRNAIARLADKGVWLAVVPLAIAAILYFTDFATAQEPLTVAPLSTPTLTAQAGESNIELSWTVVTDAVSYQLYVWDSVNLWRQLGGNTLTDTSYTHTDVADGTAYWYTVRAVNAAEQASAWSEYATVTANGPQTQTLTPTSTPVDAPTATPTATSKLGAPITRTETITPSFDFVEDSIVVTWDAPASGSVIHYILTRTHDDNGVTITKTIRVDGTSTSYIDHDVEFIAYDYVLTAYLEESAVTATPTASPTVTPTPSAQAKQDPKHSSTPTTTPTASLTATPTASPTTVLTPLTVPTLSGHATANGAELSWTAVSGAARYELWVWDSVNLWRQLGGNTLTNTSYTHTDVADGTAYWYTVRAVNAAEQASAWSEYATVTANGPQTQTLTPTSTPVDAPTATPTATSKLGAPITRTETITPSFDFVEDSIVVTWDPPASGSISHYILTRTQENQGAVTTSTFSIDGTATRYVDNDVDFASTYDYVLTVHFNAPAATATSTATPTATPTPAATPTPPPGATATPTSTPTVTLKVAPTATPTPPPGATATPTATPTPPPGATATPTSTPTSTPTVTPKVAPTATPTPTPGATATPTTTTSAVPSLTAEATESSVILRWSAVTGAVSYQLHVWRSGNWQQIGGETLTGTSYTDTNVTAGTTYYYIVRAVLTGGGTSNWSDRVAATVP